MDVAIIIVSPINVTVNTKEIPNKEKKTTTTTNKQTNKSQNKNIWIELNMVTI